MKKTIITIMLLVSSVNAETDTFRIGDLATWITDVLGFNILDATTATYDIVWLLIIFGVAIIVKKWFWR